MRRSRPVATSVVGLLAGACFGLGVARPQGQALGALRITLAVPAADATATPGARHVLLVSDNPPSRAPWRVVTAQDGTAQVRLPSGNYTVESEAPLRFQGKAYEWRQTVDISAGREVTVALTADNADISHAVPPEAGAPARIDAWDSLIRWQDSLVTLWTPTTRASGVVADATGLIVTARRAVGTATAVEVQLTPALKVQGQVLVHDAARDVTVLRIDPATFGGRVPGPLGCDLPDHAVVEPGLAISAMGTALRGGPHMAPGVVRRVDSEAIAADLDLDIGSAGGPVVAADGGAVGLVSAAGEAEGTGEGARAVPMAAVCSALADARARTTGSAPTGTPLPVEPADLPDEEQLRQAMKRRAGSLNPYATESATFDITLITPVLAFAGMEGAMDFGQWSDYVANRPPVLLVRVTPKQVERFWFKVARGAAMTQGIALPPIKRFTPGFARMRALCAGREVTPIHPFVIERRVSETSAIREGLYVFAPDALGPHCATVTLEVFSEKAPDAGESAPVPAAVVAQLWDDLAPYRRPPTDP